MNAVVVVGTVAKADGSWIRGGVAHGDIDTVVAAAAVVVDRVVSVSVSAVAVRAVGVGSRDCSWWTRIRIRIRIRVKGVCDLWYSTS